MNFLVITFGISGSGKTTVAKEYEKEGFIRISLDDMRVTLTGSLFDFSKEKEVLEDCLYKVFTSLKKGKNVIFDSLGLDYILRKRIQRVAAKTNTSASILVFTDSENKELCKSRIQNLEELKAEFIINKQYQEFKANLEFLEDEGFDTVLDYEKGEKNEND